MLASLPRPIIGPIPPTPLKTFPKSPLRVLLDRGQPAPLASIRISRRSLPGQRLPLHYFSLDNPDSIGIYDLPLAQRCPSLPVQVLKHLERLQHTVLHHQVLLVATPLVRVVGVVQRYQQGVTTEISFGALDPVEGQAFEYFCIGPLGLTKTSSVVVEVVPVLLSDHRLRRPDDPQSRGYWLVLRRYCLMAD